MSSSITIPTRQAYAAGGKVGSSSSSSSCYSTSPQTPQQKGKSPMSTPSKSTGHNRRPSMLTKRLPTGLYGPRRAVMGMWECFHVTAVMDYESLTTGFYAGSSFSQQEHTVINIGDPDGTPRLITCVRYSQGYEWNPEIFLPSYMESDFESIERKRDPVHEINLSDEEMKNMFPQ
ncbi:hypothetical protein V492_06370 [Pseudogymnoascus sp. VKM F-4246]|nr:hypothetical protein V492_06370 [Pseudogymnoascus sp. VKM F-4246]